MNEKEKNFITDWNLNAHKISDDIFFGKSYLELTSYCLNIHKEILVEEILLKLFKNQVDYGKKIKKFDELLSGLSHVYHVKCIDTDLSKEKIKRRYRYVGENGFALDLKIKREVVFTGNEIMLAQVNQEFIDVSIVEEFHSVRDYYNESKYRFIFHQCEINDFSLERLEAWSNIYSKKVKSKENFLSEVYLFVKKYESLDLDIDKLELFIKTYFKYKGFSHFQDYTKLDFSLYTNESIDLFKALYFAQKLKEYKAKEKISIDTSTFRKNEIKRINKSLKTKPSYPSYRFGEDKPNIYDTYNHLVNGNRKEFDNLMKKERAGEVEAMVGFLDYLSGLEVKRRKKVVVKQHSDSNSKDLLPIELFDNTRNYLKKNAMQVNTSYKYKAYDACSILLRKITEILIIEIYEKEEIEHKIKDSDGNYLMLKGLINCFTNEKKFSKVLSRNMSEILPKIKRNGDLSAHNRKYNSRKLDIDKLSDDFRLLFEEMINSIYH